MGKTVQEVELLSTKLAPPQLRPPFVLREALLAHIDRGLEQKLTLISAPAGFGKTTLVCEWIDSHREKGDLPPVAWVSLDPEDNDPVRFWRYLLTACQAFGGEVSGTALALLSIPGQPAFESVITDFINKVDQLPGKRVLVIEDYHLISSPEVHETLAFCLDHLPGALHIILATRSDPPLPLARLRAHNELNELRLADLRFSLDETQAFFQRAVPYPLPSEEVARLFERTEGWAAGLRLVALALQGKEGPADAQQYLETFTGSHRPILEYLIEDVFSCQSESIQEFLLQTSILPRLSASLCDAITGRQDSAQILEQIERTNLFLTPLDPSRRWYRFHALFAEAMQHYARQRLGEAHLRELAQKASLWFEEHEYLAVAVEAALFTSDYSRAVDLIEHLIAPRLVQNEYQTLRRWLERVPEEALYNHPNVCMTFAVAILFTSDRHAPETKARIQPLLQIAEQHWQQQENETKLGMVYAFRSLVAWQQRDLEESFSMAKKSLTLLPEQDRQWRGISLIMVGVDELLQGKLDSARKTITEALALNETAENIFGTLDSMLLLGEVYTRQGELHQAAQLFNQVLARAENAPMDRDMALLRKGRAFLGLGYLALEWDDLDAAEDAIAQGVSIGQGFPEEDFLVDGPAIQAQLMFARGQVDQARELLRSLSAEPGRAFRLRSPRADWARVALASGDLAGVQRWAATEAIPGDEIPPAQLEEQALLIARLRIAEGEAGGAIQLLDRLLVEAQDHGRTRSQLEIGILQALASAALSEPVQAKAALIQALTLAHPEGHQRIFLDEGEKLAALIRDTLPEIRGESLAAYARSLLYKLVQEQAKKAAGISPGSNVLIEPLSEQEQRVLRLLAAGLSNPEIASELVISINTVKTHVKNIYGKLGINSRDQARDAAKQMKIM